MSSEHDVVERVLRLREAGNVERCHTMPHYDQYSVGKHCYDMLALLVVLHPDPPARLFRAVIYHDAHERFTGDIPGALKYLAPEIAAYMDEQKARIDAMLGYVFPELTDEDRAWLKTIDRIEFFLWVEDQIALGNQHVSGRRTSIVDQLADMSMPDPCRMFLDTYRWHRTGDNSIKPKE